MIPASHDEATVVFSGFHGTPRFLVRHRVVPPVPLAAPAFRAANDPPALTAGPNPLPRGGALSLFARGALREPWVDVFDVAGRRLASVALRGEGDRWRGELDARETRLWPAGVYFVRPRSGTGGGRSWVMLR